MKDSLPELEVTLADVGERAALSAIFPLLPRGENLVLGPGDDSAIVDANVASGTQALQELSPAVETQSPPVARCLDVADILD